MGYTFKDISMFQRVSGVLSGIFIFAALCVSAFFIYQDAVLRFLDPKAAEAGRPEFVAFAARKETVIPARREIAVPFSAQAPFGDWGQPWQDACEETSVLMAVAWARGFDLNPDFAATEILRGVAFENRVLGYHQDTNVADTARLFREFYHYENVDIWTSGVTIEDVKKELARGNLVIVPLAGKILAKENPYFTSPPHYHMVVIRGYDEIAQEFIVNEPGTRHGEAFRYSFENLFAAIHDWTGSAETILDGQKAMLVVKPLTFLHREVL